MKRAAVALLFLALAGSACRERDLERAALAAVPVPDSPWSSAESCRALVNAGKRRARAPGSARIGTWNIRWFPDGGPGRAAPKQGGTDLAWLACAITWLNVDVLALQEIKNHARARERSRELIEALNRSSGGKWQLRVDDCPNEPGQHVALLWNGARAKAERWLTLASLNPHGEPCKDQLRPGLGAYFRFVGGLDLFVVSAHLKSGGERRSYELRRRSISGLGSALTELQIASGGDDDVVVAGDLNTMGCASCSPPISSDEELALVDAESAALGLRAVASSARCTEYADRRGGALDHFLAATRMAELPARQGSVVAGYCAEARCRPLRGQAMPLAHRDLSDHCPVVLDVQDRDAD